MQHSFLHCLRLPWPVDWAELFGRDAPLLVEIGFGNGRFLLEMARQRPSHNLVGMEISLPSLRKAAHKVARDGLDYVRVIQGSAQALLWGLCRPGDLSGVVINFPDPWPKAAHHHRRLINGRFLHLAATRLRPGAPLDVATDHADYAAVIAACLQETPYFDSRLDAPYLTDDPGRVRTKYEMKAIAAGSTCHYFKWQRNRVAAPDIFPNPQEFAMPHVVLRSPLPLQAVVEQFAPQYISGTGVEIKFIEVYESTRRNSLFIETYVHEEPMSQRVGLSLRARGEGDWVLGLHELGFPRPTAGMHQAVQALADWLVGLHPEMEIVQSTLVTAVAPEE